MAGIFIIAGLLYFSLDYTKENKERTVAVNAAFATPDSSLNFKMQEINQKYESLVDNKVYENFLQQSKGDRKVARALLTALHSDSQAFFGKYILHSLLIVALTIILIGLFVYKKIKATVVLIALPLITLFDLIPFDMHYINDKSFDNAEKYHAGEFPQSEADKQILADKDPNYRVLNMAGGDPFQEAKTSYYHKSIGGYHPAKLGIFDDLITYQMSGQPNPSVINMMNVKYVIQGNQQGSGAAAYPNPGALGNCWFVKGVKFVDGPVEEMRSLDKFNPKDTAIIDNSYKNILTRFAAADSTSIIKQMAFDNMAIQYQSNSNTANVAIFSEVFYKDWNAYIDGKLTPVAKANYVLRALLVPAGKHTIDFKFEPKVYKISYNISLFATWLLVALLIAYFIYILKQNKKQITP